MEIQHADDLTSRSSEVTGGFLILPGHHYPNLASRICLRSRGRGVVVVQSVADFEKAKEERTFMHVVVEGLADLEEGREVSFVEAKARFGQR